MSVWDSESRIAYTFGGVNSGNVLDVVLQLQYNVTSQQVWRVAQLPGPPRNRVSAVWDPDRRVALILGGWGAQREMLEYDPRTRIVTKLPFTLEHSSFYDQSVYVDGKVYLFAGSSAAAEWGPLAVYATEGWSELIRVDGWPLTLSRSAAVYVESHRRIYLFGGEGRFPGETSVKFRDEIMYNSTG